jgi:hypothetical protein
VAPGFFPLDEELALLPGTLSPWLAEALVRLSTHIPSFAKASRELAWFTGVTVHPDTARRRTEAAGAVLVAHETAEAEQIVREHPAPPCTPDTLVFSVDGAMVPLRHGQWTEVRTLAVGDVQPPQATPDGPVIHTSNLSYFSRRTDSTSFSTLATRELHRRGIEGARRVGAVVDGAVWCQSFIDLHYPEAVREWVRTSASDDDLATALAYLEARVAQMAYPQFQAEGWPMGSGMVESANKLVVEDRLKGAGMHWAEANVNPLLALRNAVCNDRWDESWTIIEREQRRTMRDKRQQRRTERQATRVSDAPPPGAAAAIVPPASPCASPPVEELPHTVGGGVAVGQRVSGSEEPALQRGQVGRGVAVYKPG